jgi:drug/metabolite transporter (DMT)-like permease
MYALTNVVSRAAVVVADPLAAPVFRLLPTLAIAWTQVARSGARWRTLRPSAPDFVGWRAMLILFLGGALGTSAGTLTFFYALQVGGVVLTVPVVATYVLWSAIISVVFLKERLNARMVVGILIAVSGVALLGYGRSAGSAIAPGALAAIPLALVTAIGWAASANCTRYALARDVDKYLAIALAQTCGLVVLLGGLFVSGRGALLWTTALSAIGLFLLAGILSAIAVICDAHALSLTTVASALTISGTNPVLSTILAVLFLHEELKPLMAAGIVLTVAGVLFAQLSKGQNGESANQRQTPSSR